MKATETTALLAFLKNLSVEGFEVSCGTLRHSPEDAKVTLTFTRPGETPELVALKRIAPEAAGLKFGPYTLVGYKPRARKAPFIVADDAGRRYTISGAGLRVHGDVTAIPEWALL